MVGRGPAADPGLVPAGSDPTATVLLGPGGENPLFTELAPSLQARSGLAAPSAAWKAGDRTRDCDVVLMVRRRGESGGDRTLVLSAMMERDGWDLHVLSSPGLIWDRPIGEVRAGSDAGFRSLERDALVAVMGVTGGAATSASR